MKKYLVGGAVRDLILNLPIKDKDYVVVGSSPAELKALGFVQVACAFPVFIDPVNKHEYALARVESKTGRGHKGFSCLFDKHVSLYEDLYRRDLTMNAIALDDEGHFYDPYHGMTDIAERRIKHVSERFAEDPLRVLRVSRFYARFYPQGFFIDPATIEIMRTIVLGQELKYISGERIFMEICKVLDTTRPDLFFITLQELDVFSQILLPLAQLSRATLSSLAFAVTMTQKSEYLFTVLLCTLNLDDIQIVLQSLKAPKIILRLLTIIKKYERILAGAAGTPEECYAMIKEGLRIKNNFEYFSDLLALLSLCYPDSISQEQVALLQQMNVTLNLDAYQPQLTPQQLYQKKLGLLQKLIS